MSPFLSMFMTLLSGALAMAFYTLLERKILGYAQTRKGPNKVMLMGLPQPFADAMKLFMKELNSPSLANMTPFIFSPCFALLLALLLWTTYPHTYPSYILTFGLLLFLLLSSLNVYATLISGWASNSKYSLLGAIRSIAQTISYEVSMVLILIVALVIIASLNLNYTAFYYSPPLILMIFPISIIWFITSLAETARTPFDFAEGESELVSGFNTEFSGSLFAFIFMAEYMNILVFSIITASLFIQNFSLFSPLAKSMLAMTIATLFICIRASYPRMRYDRLMALTWKVFLPFSLVAMLSTFSVLSIIT